MGVQNLINVKKQSVALLFLAAIVVPAVIAALSKFDFIDLSPQSTDILAILTGLFVVSEIGLMKLFDRASVRKDPLRWFGVIVGLAIVVFASLSLLEITAPWATTAQGVLSVLGVLYAVTEAVRV